EQISWPYSVRRSSQCGAAIRQAIRFDRGISAKRARGSYFGCGHRVAVHHCSDRMIAAVSAALLMGLIARDAIGMLPDMVCGDAPIAPSIVVAVVAGISWRKLKQKL